MGQNTNKKSPFTFFGPAFFGLFFLGCTRHQMNGSGPGWDHMMGYSGYGGMFMWLIWIIIAGVVIYLFVNRIKGTGILKDPSTERPEDILKRRYARGEITREEFEKLKRDIKG
jgi:putative membrane protein